MRHEQGACHGHFTKKFDFSLCAIQRSVQSGAERTRHGCAQFAIERARTRDETNGAQGQAAYAKSTSAIDARGSRCYFAGSRLFMHSFNDTNRTRFGSGAAGGREVRLQAMLCVWLASNVA